MTCSLFSDEGPDTNFSMKTVVGNCVLAWTCHCGKEHDPGNGPLSLGVPVGATFLVSNIVLAPF